MSHNTYGSSRTATSGFDAFAIALALGKQTLRVTLDLSEMAMGCRTALEF